MHLLTHYTAIFLFGSEQINAGKMQKKTNNKHKNQTNKRKKKWKSLDSCRPNNNKHIESEKKRDTT